MRDVVAIHHADEDAVIVHAGPADTGGDYATLCGLDGDDPGADQRTVPVPRGGRARIDCDHCCGIIKKAWTYTARDLA